MDDFIDGAVLEPRAQLRFFKAVEQLIVDAHVARLRFKEVKETESESLLEFLFRYIYKRWDVTPSEMKRQVRSVTRIEIFKARKHFVVELKKHGYSNYRIAKMIGVGHPTPGTWEKYDVDISD